jgi:hypothetical protein
MTSPIERLAVLEQLLKGLPETLPFHPLSSTYVFQLNMEDVEDKGVFGVLSHCLEVALQTHSVAIKQEELRFSEHGPRLERDLMELL